MQMPRPEPVPFEHRRVQSFRSPRRPAVTARVTTLRGEEAGGYYVEAPAPLLPRGRRAAGPVVRRLRRPARPRRRGRRRRLPPPDGRPPSALRRGSWAGPTGRSRCGATTSRSRPRSRCRAVGRRPARQVQAEVEAAHDAAVAAVVGFVERQATTRGLPSAARSSWSTPTGSGRGGVPPAHQPGARPPAPHPRRGRRQGRRPATAGGWPSTPECSSATSGRCPPSTTPACGPS